MVARRDETDQWSVVGVNNQRLSSHITVVAGRVGVDLQVGLWQHQQLVVLLQLQPPLRRLRGRAHRISYACGEGAAAPLAATRLKFKNCAFTAPIKGPLGRFGAILRGMNIQLQLFCPWTDTRHFVSAVSRRNAMLRRSALQETDSLSAGITGEG